MSKNGYVIQVGHYAPQKVIVATPDKTTGNPTGNIIEAYGGVGAHILINRARVWARRVMDDGKLAKGTDGGEMIVEVTTKDYHGKLEFLEWGKSALGAQAIEIRYLPQSQSLDTDYQDTIQKIKLDPEGKDGSAFITLSAGENKYDLNKGALFISYLQVHPQNKDSKSKNPNPNIKGFMFFEVTDEITDNAAIKQSEAKITAGSFVVGLSEKQGQLKNLLEIFIGRNVEFGNVDMLSNDLDMYKALLKFAEEKPGDFGFFINEYKKDLSDLFEKAKSYNVLDLTKNGFVGILIDNKPEMVYENVEGKKEEMLDYVMENFLDNVIYERTKHLKVMCGKLN